MHADCNRMNGFKQAMGKLLSKKKPSKDSRQQTVSRGGQQQCGAGDTTLGNRATSRPSVHSDAVVSVTATSPGHCVTGSKDKTVVLYDFHNGQVKQVWTGHEREITKVCYGQRCNAVFSASRDKMIKMWQPGTDHCVRDFSGHQLVVTAIHPNTDNSLLCSGSRDNTVRIWDVETGTCLKQHSIPQNLVTDVKWLPGSPLIIQAGEDKEVRLYDSRTLAVVRAFTKKQYIQMCCDVSPDGNLALTCSNGFGGNGCEATLWQLSDGSICREFKGHREAIEACVFLPSTQLLATASRDCSLCVWDKGTAECVSQYNFEGTGPLTSIAAYDDGSIVVGTFNLGVQVLKLTGHSLTLVSSF